MTEFFKIGMASIIGLAAMLSVTATRADFVVQFEEDAPKDRFIIENASACNIASGVLSVDLGGSKAGLIFDTARGGVGENVAQPFEVAAGAAFIPVVPRVLDGAQSVDVSIVGLTRHAAIWLTVDVDDSDTKGPMGVQMIANSEIAGASVTLKIKDGERVTGTFGADGFVRLPLRRCS